MKKYHTLVQAFTPETDRLLGEYLTDQGIEYSLGADLESELTGFSVYPKQHPLQDRLLKKYTVLIEEHELSAIMLSVGGVSVVDNDRSAKIKNAVRTKIGWLFGSK